MKGQAPIALRARESSLKRKVRAHLRDIGFKRAADGSLVPPALDKDSYRAIHAHQRAEKLAANDDWLSVNAPKLLKHFASGREVEVTKIRPRLELAPGQCWQSDLFRLAGLYWRIPISEGYGRRLRFLVWDDNNGKLIGLLALGDAVFNLRERDRLIGWDHRRRGEALVNLMDAYVLGALPPYNAILGGKLVATLARTSDVVSAFDAKYRESVGVISKKAKHARLAAITTSSALGRSSIYNRLKVNGQTIFEPIGYSTGFGHFHISDRLFEDLRTYLNDRDDPYASGFRFGNGPNWRLRVIRQALRLLGMDPDLIRHGFRRELFLCRLATNAIPFLAGKHKRIRYEGLPTVVSASRLALDRWVIPRAERNPEFANWSTESLFAELLAPTPRSFVTGDEKVWTGRRIG